MAAAIQQHYAGSTGVGGLTTTLGGGGIPDPIANGSGEVGTAGGSSSGILFGNGTCAAGTSEMMALAAAGMNEGQSVGNK